MNSTPPMGPPHHENFPPGELHHEAPGIEFMVEDAPDFELSDAEGLLEWIERVAKVHEHRIVQLTYIFCSDDYLHRLNVEYLDHDTLTDVITFDNSDDADMLEGQGGSVWLAKVSAVYDVVRMRQLYDQAMLAELGNDAEALAGIEGFFATDLGARVMALELAARRTLLDETAEAAAERSFAAVKSAGGPRLRGLADFIEVNDLIESNVMGALNANLAFYRGLAAEGAFDGEMTEDQMLAEVWSAEADVRAETEDWLFPFLNLAYQPLTEAELQDYVAFSRTIPGQRLNRAMFVAFDEIFAAISLDLGRALGREMQGQAL